MINFVFTDIHLVILSAFFVAFGYAMAKNGFKSGFSTGSEMTFKILEQGGVATEQEMNDAVERIAKFNGIDVNQK